MLLYNAWHGVPLWALPFLEVVAAGFGMWELDVGTLRIIVSYNITGSRSRQILADGAGSFAAVARALENTAEQ